ncbi:TonB family protein [Curvibacter sp. RS43]|uniref:TonB family protein n=1 Tax=Curvibacter microcysteis TaxID=3026419 RepID=A0ABT5M9I3_9BURK|nr:MULTISPECIES: TonB family protein [unclassified Curvibacter]MDD0812091.1 TonB family protein [Curvibacter sp. RS43]MDD0813055.1 TonB family protein [Curvibacter sp. HBC28]
MSPLASLRRLSTLQITLALSLAVHAALLTVRFVDPGAFNRVFQDTPLEVILVNAKSNARPDKATAIAQASLAGGGEASRGRATSPLPSAALSSVGDTLEETQRQLAAMEQQQARLLAEVRRQLAALPAPPPARDNTPQPDTAQEEKRRQLIKLLAEIERRVNEENARPKKRYISPATREEVYATYYDQLRHKVEDKGTENFPEQNGKKLYGELTMTLTIDAQGKLLGTEIVQSSGNRTLDRRAEAIARSAQPFGAFSAAMRRQADQIVVVSRFRFTRDETLEAKVQ